MIDPKPDRPDHRVIRLHGVEVGTGGNQLGQQEEAATAAEQTQQELANIPPLSSFRIDTITSAPLTSVAELIDLSESLQTPLNSSSSSWAFRGQSQAFGTLVPSFQRQFVRQSFGAAEIIEHRMIDAFRTHFAELKDRSAEMPLPDRIGFQRDLRCLSVMQHYEIPTRLLDWTSDMWTAIYFACASDPGTQAELWCYDRGIFGTQRVYNPELNPFVDHSENAPPEPAFLYRRSEALIVELDPQITPRMKQQKAHHTVSSNAFSDHAPLIFDLQTQYYQPSRSIGLRRFLIDGSCKSKALQFLADEMNITASTIFPDVVGLGRFLRWQFESLRTMLL